MTTSRRRFLAAVSAASATSGPGIAVATGSAVFWRTRPPWARSSAARRFSSWCSSAAANDGLNYRDPLSRRPLQSRASPAWCRTPGPFVKIGEDLGFHQNLKGFGKLLETKQFGDRAGSRLSESQSLALRVDGHLAHLPHRSAKGQGRPQHRLAGPLSGCPQGRRSNRFRPWPCIWVRKCSRWPWPADSCSGPSIRSLDEFRLDTAGSEARRQLIESSLRLGANCSTTICSSSCRPAPRARSTSAGRIESAGPKLQDQRQVPAVGPWRRR